MIALDRDNSCPLAEPCKIIWKNYSHPKNPTFKGHNSNKISRLLDGDQVINKKYTEDGRLNMYFAVCINTIMLKPNLFIVCISCRWKIKS